jgi:uncharacterized protein (TIGR03437 family)
MLEKIRVPTFMRKPLSIQNKGRAVTLLLTLPVLVWAFSSGPPPRSEGGPGGSASACAQSGCHVGTAVNGGGGNVQLQFPNGLTYTPGQKQRIRVVITDANGRNYGFQASARLASNETSGQAGRFDGASGLLVICSNDSERSASGNCPANAPLEFIEHSRPSTSGTFEFDWTAPATDVGNVKFYVAGNAGNANGSTSGDRIYTASYTLTPGAAANPPAITSQGGVTNGASFAPGVVSGSWTTIFGSNLAKTTRDWTGAIDGQGNFPTSLDGVSVTIDGKAAPVNFISPNQINVQAPDLEGKTGPVQVIVKTADGESAPVSVNAAKELPGLFLFTQAPKRFPAVVRADGTFIGPASLFPGVTTVPAKPGDVVLFFGTGFGPTSPAVAPGKVFSGAAPLVDSVQMRIGGVSVTPAFAGISSSGLYQFNVTIPELVNGEHPVEMSINSVNIQSDVVLAVQR